VLSSPLSEPLAELIAKRFRVLAEPNRIRILDRLRAGETSVQDLTQSLGMSQQNVSKHVGILAAAGIVERRKDGNLALYRIVDESVLDLCEQVCGSLARQVEELEAIVSGSSR
jgi:DNA-binding transcriptional ArsR family regulator